MTSNARRHGTGAVLIGALCSSGCDGERQEAARPDSEGAAVQPSAPEDASRGPSMAATTGAAAPLPPPEARQSAFRERQPERDDLTGDVADEGVEDRAVLRAIRIVPRHAFVSPALQASAYV